MTDLYAALPPKLAEIAEVIGVQAALKLSSTWPGMRVYVPKVMKPEHELARAIGFAEARKLSDHYGGEWLCPPMCAQMHRQARRALMLKRLDEGATAAEVAREFSCHVYSVYRLKGEADSNDQKRRQQSLL